ncbi:type II toxin-antitoxin system RelE/ParE family toxin [Patescibacteria group bacterium]|nr:type II toxin-antitoxin system RelE/ParE family toxin [Patescibacteria group bacterium]
MGVDFVLQYHEVVVKEDIPRLSSEWKKKIKQAIEDKLTTHPEIFGRPLHQSLKNYRKLRIGDYRAIFSIEKNIVKIFAIQHRSVIYKTIGKRA